MDFEGRARIRSHLDIAPLIDIVFLLLVFFMLTSTFLTPEAIELQLPESDTATVREHTPINIAVDATGQIRLDNEPIPLQALRAALTPRLQDDPQQTVTLTSDARIEVQSLLRVMDEIRAAGGTNIALATHPR